MSQEGLRSLMVAIADGDASLVSRMLQDWPELTVAAIAQDASRADPAPSPLQQLSCYCYRGDTALHVAAAAHRPAMMAVLLELDADVGARNRRGTTALHHAAAGAPESPRYDPAAQVETIVALLAAGADPDAVNRDGATPLHRAIRSRCSVAVATLLTAGASAVLPHGSGSSPLDLAKHSTGRGGSGSTQAKREQVEIIRLLTASISDAPRTR